MKNIVSFKQEFSSWWYSWKNDLDEGRFDMAVGMASGLFMTGLISTKIYFVLIDYVTYRRYYREEMTPAEFTHWRRNFMQKKTWGGCINRTAPSIQKGRII